MSRKLNFDPKQYAEIMSQLNPEEREMLEGLIGEFGGPENLAKMISAEIDQLETMLQEQLAEKDQLETMLQEKLAENEDFDLNKYVEKYMSMTDEDFAYGLGIEPDVSPMQEEMAWQATDELLSKFFKK